MLMVGYQYLHDVETKRKGKTVPKFQFNKLQTESLLNNIKYSTHQTNIRQRPPRNANHAYEKNTATSQGEAMLRQVNNNNKQTNIGFHFS